MQVCKQNLNTNTSEINRGYIPLSMFQIEETNGKVMSANYTEYCSLIEGMVPRA